MRPRHERRRTGQPLSLETTVAGMRRDLAHMYGDVVEGHTRRPASNGSNGGLS